MAQDGTGSGGPSGLSPEDHVLTGGLDPEGGEQARRAARGLWLAVLFVLAALVLLVVFVLENQQHVDVAFLGIHGNLPLGLALILAAVIGGLAVIGAGIARILRVRSRRRRRRRRRRT